MVEIRMQEASLLGSTEALAGQAVSASLLARGLDGPATRDASSGLLDMACTQDT